MRLEQYLLNEKYLERIKTRKGSVEIFINPSRKELIESNGKYGIRFIADNKTKKLYVWNAYDANHFDVWKQLKGKELPYIDVDMFHGLAETKGGKVILKETHQVRVWVFDKQDDKIKQLYKNFQWMNKYIDISNLYKILELELTNIALF